MGERKREVVQHQPLSRHHHSVDNINHMREAAVMAAAGDGPSAPRDTARDARDTVNAVNGDGNGNGVNGGDVTAVRQRDKKEGDKPRERERQSAFLNRDTAGKPNRFGWRSWSSHRLSDLSAKKVLDWLREPSASNKDSQRITTVVATPGQGSERTQEVTYSDSKIIGNGNFGVVYQAKLCDSGEQVAIKKVLQDRRFKNRELQIMRRLTHCNVVMLKYFFYSAGDQQSDEVYLNLVLEYLPETVHKVARRYKSGRQTIPISFIKLYMYQLFRALAYIHSLGICHRDIKPPNLLVDPESGVLKLIDFGSAKVLTAGEANVAYICSRYYRAPELIFGATDYTTSIDVWSAGCVLAELLLGRPIFAGDNSVNQLVEVIRQLGTPTREQLAQMNPNYKDSRFPEMRARPWNKLFRAMTPPEAIDLVSQLLQFTPQSRLTPQQACCHPFFAQLRDPNTRLPNGRPLPPLFDLSEHELSLAPALNGTLMPDHARRTTAAGSSAASPPSLVVSPPSRSISETSPPVSSKSQTAPSKSQTAPSKSQTASSKTQAASSKTQAASSKAVCFKSPAVCSKSVPASDAPPSVCSKSALVTTNGTGPVPGPVAT